MQFYTFTGLCLIIIFNPVLSKSITHEISSTIILASTTSADNSGLYDYILPKFKEQTGIAVNVVAVGTGRAINIAVRGDADVLIIHDKESELQFMQDDYGIERKTFMYNDYILIGPIEDFAGILDVQLNVLDALKRIHEKKALFISRGDDSGTHKRELSLWQAAKITIDSRLRWYREIGGGMGQALNIANQMGAYTLSDRSTWVSFKNRENLQLIAENHPALINAYSIILVNPKRYPAIKFREAKIFSDWLTSEVGLALIRQYKVSDVQLFHTY